MPRLQNKKLGTLPLILVIFFTISGGPYGLEPLLYYCGNGALMLLTVVPILWDIPIILTVSELNCLMPLTGGYYQWVKQALGLRWAFYEGWWSWLCNFVDLAIYPQLFVLYASLFIPGIASVKTPVCLALIWGCVWLNIMGIRLVGKTSIILGILTITHFIILFVTGIGHPAPLHFQHLAVSGKPALWGMAVFTIIWNFIGWDNITTYAEEVDQPVRAYLRTMPVAFLLVFGLYFGVVVIAQNSGISPSLLMDKGFPALANIVAGPWLSVCISIGGILSTVGMFIAVLLSVSRVPEAMAADRLLPQKLNALHPKYKTPYLSIIICASIVSFMEIWTFGELLVIDVTVYFAGLVLEFISLIALRYKQPDVLRPFRIPLGKAGLGIMVCLPVAVYFIALWDIISKSDGSFKPLLFAVGMLVSGEVGWILIKLSRRVAGSVD